MNDDLVLCIPAILLGLIPAYIAHNKGRDFITWWFFGAALFIIALPVALLIAPDAATIELRRIIEEGSLKKCPYCAELIKQEAKVCRYCGRELKTA